MFRTSAPTTRDRTATRSGRAPRPRARCCPRASSARWTRKLRQDYGLSQLDVAWEAHFFDASGAGSGYVIAFRDGTDMGAVQDAVDAGLGRARGRGRRQRARPGDERDDRRRRRELGRRRRDPATRRQPANATYLARGCVADEVRGDLEELDEYSVQFEGTLVTARLGEGRTDLFDPDAGRQRRTRRSRRRSTGASRTR